MQNTKHKTKQAIIAKSCLQLSHAKASHGLIIDSKNSEILSIMSSCALLSSGPVDARAPVSAGATAGCNCGSGGVTRNE